MPIDLANVNVTIQQFQVISQGKYNASEVKLARNTAPIPPRRVPCASGPVFVADLR